MDQSEEATSRRASDIEIKMEVEPLLGVKIQRNDRLLRAIKGEDVDQVPVWIMRQAGRYLPEFREIRAKHDFFTICKTPELASEVTLQPLRRYPVDAAIIFSDILVIPEALGMEIKMEPGVGPVLSEPLEQPKDIMKLQIPINVNDTLDYVYKAIALTKRKLENGVPVIGFVGGPWTLFSYMIEGRGSKTLSKAKRWLYVWPDKSHYLLRAITNVLVDHSVGQVRAGAEVVQVFESHAEVLGYDLFYEFSLPYLRDIVQRTKEQIDVPMIIFAKGSHYALRELSESGFDVVGLDWTITPERAKSEMGDNITLQGNLDPCALYATRHEVRLMTKRMVQRFGKKRYIANLGHGIYPDVDPDTVRTFIDAAQSV